MGYRERNLEKMEQIYRAYEDDVYKVCLFFTKDEDVAYDITQQTFYTLYQHIDEADIQSFQGYLVRTARNKCFNYMRDRKHEELVESLETIPEKKLTVISVEEAYQRKEEEKRDNELGKDILECVRRENEQWHTALTLLFCLGKPNDVVADEMGISREALYSMVYRAKRWIRKNYMQKYNDIHK